MRSFVFVFLAAVVVVLVACSGTQQVYTAPTTVPTSAAAAYVNFLILVPSATTSTRGRNIVVPSSAQSVSFTLETVNGAASATAPTVESLTSSATGCQSTSTQLSCSFTLSAPVGTLVYTVSVYSGTNGAGSLLGTGQMSVTTTAGTTVSAPATLSGTLAKIVLSAGIATEGASASVPVVVQGEDASGNTILGTYSSAISLTDTDSSGQTTLSASAENVTGSSTVVTLNYAGGTMNTAAVINASATGVGSSNITPASFLPDQTYPTVNNAVTTFGYTQSTQTGQDGPPNSSISTSSGSYTVTVLTGQTFNGVSNVVQMNGLLSASAGLPTAIINCCYSNMVAYYAWTPQTSASSLGLVGMNSSSYFTLTCVAPYSKQILVPLTSNWDVRNGSGDCNSSYNDFSGDSDLLVLHADGSYKDNASLASCCSYAFSVVQDSDGSSVQTTDEYGGADSSILTIPAPTPGASTLPVSVQYFPAMAIPSPGSTTTPAPIATSVPNPWTATGIPNGTVPSPLESDTFTVVGQIGSLPANCAVPAALTGTFNEADESVIIADPAQDFNFGYYTSQAIKHYYLNGVGEICNEDVENTFIFDDGATNYYANVANNTGYDPNYDTQTSTTWTYVTATTLTPALVRAHGVKAAASAAAQTLTATTYMLVHAPMNVRAQRVDPRHRFIRR